jgi:hypothetical protein
MDTSMRNTPLVVGAVALVAMVNVTYFSLRGHERTSAVELSCHCLLEIVGAVEEANNSRRAAASSDALNATSSFIELARGTQVCPPEEPPANDLSHFMMRNGHVMTVYGKLGDHEGARLLVSHGEAKLQLLGRDFLRSSTRLSSEITSRINESEWKSGSACIISRIGTISLGSCSEASRNRAFATIENRGNVPVKTHSPYVSCPCIAVESIAPQVLPPGGELSYAVWPTPASSTDDQIELIDAQVFIRCTSVASKRDTVMASVRVVGAHM